MSKALVMSDETPPKTEPKAHDPSEPSPKDELAAALSHLRSAADLLARRIDPAVRKAASDAEKAMERVASETERTASEIQAAAKPFATNVSAELGKLADAIKKSVAHLEAVGTHDPKPAPEKKSTPPDPDDPGTLR